MHYAVHGHTAAELIVERADHTKEHMGLTTWADAPDGKIKKSDVTVSKNYLSQDEMKQLNRMVTAYLDFAENMTLRHIPLTMRDWEKRLNSFIEMFDYGILQDAGKVSAEIAKLHAERYDMIFCGENYHSKASDDIATPDVQPDICFINNLTDWKEFVTRTPEEYERWTYSVSKEAAEFEVAELISISQNKKVIVDTNISVDILKEISDSCGCYAFTTIYER